MDPSSFFFGIGIVASAAFVLYAISRGEPRQYAPPDHYRAALGQLTANDGDAALEILQRTVQSANAPPDAYLKLGNLLRARGEPQAALQVHRSLTVRRDLHPREREAILRALADDHRAMRQHVEALAALQELAALRREPGVLSEIAREQLLQDQYDAAVASLREAQKLDPALGPAEIAAFATAVVQACLARHQTADAKRFLQLALKEDDAAALALDLSGDLAMAEGDHESALYYWQKLVFAGGAAAAGVHEKLERVYFELGKFGDIERVYAQLLESRPRDVETMLAAARIALKKGEGGDAERLLRDALEAAPASRTAFQLLAGLWLDEGKIRESKDLLALHVARCAPPLTLGCPACGQTAGRQPGYCTGCGRFGDYVPSEPAR